MIANRMKPVLFALALSGALASAALARDPSPDFNNSDTGYRGHHYGHGHHGRRGQLKLFSDQRLGGASRVISAPRNRTAEGGSFAPSSYSDSFSGSSFLYIDGARAAYSIVAAQPPAGPYIAPKAKIIDVAETSGQGNFNPVNGCSYEMGVCVIRGER